MVLANLTRPRAALVLIVVVAATLGFRAFLAWIGDFGPQDLEAYESKSSVDLPDLYGQIPFFLTWSRGDGQAYLTIAADPLLQGPSRTVILPAYRFSRAGYPWLARLAVFGQTAFLPVGLLAVNLVALGVYTALVLRATVRQPKAWWLLANPALLVGVATDTPEPVAFASLMLAVESVSWLGAVAAVGLGMTRESYATILGAGRRPALTIGIAALVTVAIRLAATSALGVGLTEGSMLFTWPVVGYIDGLAGQPWPMATVSLLLMTVMFATFIRGFLVHGGWVRLAWWSTGLLGLCLSDAVTSDVLNVVRALGAVPFLWVLHQANLNDRAPGAA